MSRNTARLFQDGFLARVVRRAGQVAVVVAAMAYPSATPGVQCEVWYTDGVSDRGERNAVISGVGQCQIGRRIYRDPLDLTLEARLRRPSRTPA